MTIIESILNFADEFDMLPESGLLIAGVSGGADSMCLLEALLDISRERGFTVAAAHYNHKLRGAESDRDEKFVREHCAAVGASFFSGSGDVTAYAKKNGHSLEEAARDLRYGFFYALAEETGAVRIATAHTADDNAETMLMNLTRGTGTAGLAGIPPKRDVTNHKAQITNHKSQSANHKSQITKHKSQSTNHKPQSTNSSAQVTINDCGVAVIRPMLCISRDEVLRFLSGRNIPFVEDSTNELEIYTRNKLRQKVVPVLKDINPRFCEAAAATAAIARADEEFIAGLADRFINAECRMKNAESGDDGDAGIESVSSVGIDELLSLPFALSSRVIRKLYGANLEYSHVISVLEMCKRGGPSARLSLPGKTIYREYKRVIFGDIAAAERFQPVYPVEGGCVTIPGLGLEISCKSIVYSDIIRSAEFANINKSFTSFLFKSADICGKITVRPRREGDTIRLSGHNGTKTLKKLFIERRIPARERARIPVISDDNGVLAVYGLGAGDRAIPVPGEHAFHMVFKEKNCNDD